MDTIKIALIGTGFIADYHARGLQGMSGVEMVAVVSKDKANARKFADKYGVERAYGSISRVVEDPSINAVVISTPNKFHAPYALKFLEKGKDVFIEKPMAMNAKEGKLLGLVAKEQQQLVMVGHMWRFDRDTQYIRETVASGQLGKIFKTKGYGIHEHWGPSGWFVDPELSGGGALADMGVHAIDTVRYLLGDPLPKRVYARLSTQFGNYEVDDTGILIITWDNGAESFIESGWWQPHKEGPEASTGLYGTKGYANLFPTFLKTPKEEGFETIVPQLPERTEHCDQSIYTRQMEHFINCIKTRETPVPGIEEGQVVLTIVDAAYQSAKTGESVTL